MQVTTKAKKTNLSDYSRSLAEVTTWLVPVLLFLVFSARSFFYTSDDSFISFRYARNLAEGYGPVFNPGEKVEGYSNPLWVWILALNHFAGIDIVFAAKLFGVLFGASTVFFVYRILRNLFEVSRPIILLSLMWLASHIGLVYYSTSGMETVMYTMLLVLLNWLILKEHYFLASTVSALVLLTRPEGVLFTAPMIMTVYVRSKNVKKSLLMAVVPLLCLVMMTFWRLKYFEMPLPNTFYAKVDTKGLSLTSLFSNTKWFLIYSFQALAAGAAILALAAFGMAMSFSRKTVLLHLSLAAVVFFVWYSPGDWMSFGRFYVPALPFLTIFAATATEYIRNHLVYEKMKFLLPVLLLGISFLINAQNTFHSITQLGENRMHNPAMTCIPHVEIAQELRRLARPGESVVVNEVGAIGYYSGLRVIDLLGLTNREIAQRRHSPEGLKSYGEYILSLRPEYIMLNDRQRPWDTERHRTHQAVFDAMIATGKYREIRSFPLNYYKELILYAREQK